MIESDASLSVGNEVSGRSSRFPLHSFKNVFQNEITHVPKHCNSLLFKHEVVLVNEKKNNDLHAAFQDVSHKVNLKQKQISVTSSPSGLVRWRAASARSSTCLVEFGAKRTTTRSKDKC